MVCSIYNLENTSYQCLWPHYFYAVRRAATKLLEGQKNYMGCAMSSQAPISQQVKTERMYHTCPTTMAAVQNLLYAVGVSFGFNICWMSAFGSITISSTFYSVHVLN